METIYVLAEVELGALEAVIGRLRQVPLVVEVQAVTGPFDVIVQLRAQHINAALDVVMQQIRTIPGIRGTETLVTVTDP
ncbi:MAG: Lrp/AsnC ligand binding domain-containing protein [Thermoplasmata archaeon]